jgi:hypothetical protein
VQATADTRVIKTLGSARIQITSDGLWISVRGRDYRVNVSRLPLIPSDCPQTGVNENCVQLWDGIAWDEPREVLYLAAAPHIGQNKQWMIFAYDLRSAQIKRIGDEAGGGFGSGVVSPSGRYLAYIGYDVCGACCTTSRLVLLDTQTRDLGTFRLPAANQSERPRIIAIRWTGVSAVQYDAQIVNEPACRNGQEAKASWTGSVGVSEILNRR